MKSSVVITVLLFIGLALIGCSSDETPSGPDINAPSELTATAQSDTSVVLNWTNNTGIAGGIRVLRSTNGTSWDTASAAVDPNLTRYTDRGLTEGTNYHYRIQAYASKNSEFSNTVEVTTFPTRPINVIAERVSGYETHVTWENSSANATQVQIQRKRSTQNAQSYVTVGLVAAGAMEFLDSELTTNTTYNYRLRAAIDTIYSAWSATATVTTTVFYPNAPTNLNGTVQNANTIRVTWQDNATNELGFVVESEIALSSVWRVDSVKVPNVQNFTLTSLLPATEYNIRVYAYNDSGVSGFSNTLALTTVSGPPPAPTSLSAEVLDFSKISLSWADNANDEFEYLVERVIVPNFNYERIATLDSNSVAFLDTTVARTTTYNYRVACRNNVGLSSWSNIATVTTPDGPPTSPSNLRASATSHTSIFLSWVRRSGNEDGFRIYRTVSGQNNYEMIQQTARGVISYSDVGLQPGTWYTYRVSAFNAIAESDFTNPDSAQTLEVYHFFDDFESYQIGQAPPEPIYSLNASGSSTAIISDNLPFEGDKSLLIEDREPAEDFVQVFVTTERPIVVGDFTANMFIEPNGAFGIVGVAPGTNYVTFQVQLNADGSYLYRNATQLLLGNGVIPRSEWIKFSIKFNVPSSGQSTYRIFVNDEPVSPVLQTQRNDHNGNASIIFVGFNNAAINFVSIDNLSIKDDIPVNAPQNLPEMHYGNGTETIHDYQRAIKILD